MDSRLELASDELLLKARRNGEAAFAVFYRRHVGQVLGFVRGRGADAQVAADVVSNTFLAAMRARGRYEPASETALPWLLTIATRQLVDASRRDARQDRLTRRFASAMARDLSPGDTAAYDREDPRSAAVDEALGRLPSEQQAALRGRVVDELDYPQLAANLGVSEATVRQRVSRGLRSVRELVANTTKEQHDA